MEPTTPTSFTPEIDSETLSRNLQELRQNITSAPTYHNTFRVDNDFLSRFLFCSKQDIEKSQIRYFNYYKCITQIPGAESIEKGDPREIVELIKTIRQQNLKPLMNFYGFDKFGRGIIVMEPGNIDLSSPKSYYSMVMMSIIYLDFLLENIPELKTHGIVSIKDHGFISLKVLKTIVSDRKIMGLNADLFQNGMPLIIKSAIGVNEPAMFGMVWKVIKVFLSKKMISRMMFFGKNHEKVQVVLGGAEFVPDILDGGLRSPSLEYSLTDEVLEHHILKAFPSKIENYQ